VDPVLPTVFSEAVLIPLGALGPVGEVFGSAIWALARLPDWAWAGLATSEELVPFLPVPGTLILRRGVAASLQISCEKNRRISGSIDTAISRRRH
jgi:hypothetical protein